VEQRGLVRWLLAEQWHRAGAHATAPAAGTTLGVDVELGGGNSGPRKLTPAGNRLFFTATRQSGVELFVTDGTTAGTQQFDLFAGNNGSNPDRLTALGNRVVFTASDATTGLEAWGSDGTVAGTQRLADFQLGATSGFFDGFATMGGFAWFSANVPGSGIELCRTNGTVAGTQLFADLAPGPNGSRPNGFVAAGNRLWFRAYVSGLEVGLWTSDGTVAGTRAVLDLPGTLSADITDMVPVGDTLWFFADDRVHGRELWFSNGTAAGTQMVRDLGPGFAHGVVPGTLSAVAGTGLVVFAGSDGSDGLQLWLSDGTANGTVQLGRFGSIAGSGAASLQSLTVLGSLLLFVGDDGVLGQELWLFDLGAPGAALAQNYGSSQCPGSGNRTPHIVPFGLPTIANANFAIDVVDALPNSWAVLFVAPSPSALIVDSCRVLLGLPFASLPAVPTTSAGTARTPIPVPNNPTLVGAQFFAQYGVLDPQGPLLGQASASDALWVRVGN
jgi:ELWxxDGT repeat protein